MKWEMSLPLGIPVAFADLVEHGECCGEDGLAARPNHGFNDCRGLACLACADAAVQVQPAAGSLAQGLDELERFGPAYLRGDEAHGHARAEQLLDGVRLPLRLLGFVAPGLFFGFPDAPACGERDPAHFSVRALYPEGTALLSAVLARKLRWRFVLYAKRFGFRRGEKRSFGFHMAPFLFIWMFWYAFPIWVKRFHRGGETSSLVSAVEQ